MNQQRDLEHQELQQERWQLLEHINAIAEKPMIALAFVWLWLLIMDFTTGLGPVLQTVNYVIWILFILDFAIEIVIAPDRSHYLRQNWLTALSLALPALRVLRAFRALRLVRAARTARSVSLLRLVASLNRGMAATAAALGKRGIGYVVALTMIVLFAGAAGMLAFERPETEQAVTSSTFNGIDDYGEAVWWTAMLLTTAGSDYWPQTTEGRILCFFLALYAFAIFGYITATIASFFVDSSRKSPEKPHTIATEELAAVHNELAALRSQLMLLSSNIEAFSDQTKSSDRE